jgi:hypothetical protein
LSTKDLWFAGGEAPARTAAKSSLALPVRTPTGILLLLAGWFVLAAPARASVVFGDIVVSPEPVPAGDSKHGYIEYGVSVTNRSAREAHEVTLTIPKNKYSTPDHHIRSIFRSVQVGPSSTVRVALLQPAMTLAEQGLQVAIDGRIQPQDVSIALHNDRSEWNVHYGASYNAPFILVSRRVSPNFEALSGARTDGWTWLRKGEKPSEEGREAPRGPIPAGGGAEAPTTGFQWYRAETPVTAWSTSWLGYSCYDGVVVTAADVGDMPLGVRSAVEQYVECGGTLVVLGPWQVPASWEQGQTRDKSTIYYTGFGECLVSRETDPEKWGRKDWHALAISWSGSAVPFQKVRTVADANQLFPVVENLSIPVRGLFILMLLFVVLIGPVNLFTLSKKKRKIWLLWTVPAISLVTCGVVLGYMIVSEGWHGHARAEGLTVLDETSRRAATLGWTGFYSPLTPGDGLHFGADTELTPQLATHGYYRRSGGSARTLDWTHDQHLATGWVTARVPAHFMLRKSEARRERVTVHRGRDGSLRLVNGLGADIDRLWLASKRGTIYTAAHVPAGGKAVLVRRPELGTAAGEVDTLRTFFRGDWTTLDQTLTTAPRDHLRPGCYVAALDGAPFIEPGLKGSGRQARSVVYGIMKERARRCGLMSCASGGITAGPGRWTTSPSPSPPGRSSASSAPTAPARAPPCASWPLSTSRPTATPSWTASRSSRSRRRPAGWSATSPTRYRPTAT